MLNNCSFHYYDKYKWWKMLFLKKFNWCYVMLIKGELHSMDYLLDSLNGIKKNLQHNNPVWGFDTQNESTTICLFMIHRYRCSHSLPSRAATASLKEQKWLIADLFTSVLEVSYVNASSRAQRGVEGHVFVNINLLKKWWYTFINWY